MRTHLDPAKASPDGAVGRFSTVFAAIWLFFLAKPAVEFADRWTSPRVFLAYVALVAFVGAYVWLFERMRRMRLQWEESLPAHEAWAALGVMVGAMVVMAFGWGQSAIGTTIFLAVAAAMTLPAGHALSLILQIAAATVLAMEFAPGWERDLYMPPLILSSGYVMWGVRRLLDRNLQLTVMRHENDSLLLDNERNRFARDLHDILGHSLTVITVKAELAGRLLEQDPARAAQEVRDLERLSRDALEEVREAVRGYRTLTLPGELARARTTLTTAGITPHLPLSSDDVPSHLRELFAWTIREGVTNVVKHSGATVCSIELSSHRLAIRNDLARVPQIVEGSGLKGLRERARSAGAEVTVEASEHEGYLLEVVGL